VPESKLDPSSELEWSQVRETALMLKLAIAQITSALNDGDDSVNQLGNSFTTIIGNVEAAHLAASSLSDSNEKTTIINNCTSAIGEMQHSIVSFQFYDKLTQRLSHVSNSLDVLANIVTSPEKLHNPDDWRSLQEKIKSNYTVESERLMFDFILQGHSLEEALAMGKQAEEELNNENNIELF